ncbi:MAG: MmgE/PrpD family protein [Pseudomonadota bacterium]
MAELREAEQASGAASSATFESVARFTLELSAEAIPEPVLERAALLLLDTLGICAAAAPMEAGRIGRETARRLFAPGRPEDAATMLFDGRPASLAGAIFAAATQTDNLDGHDGYNPTKGHIGVVAVPALAALAEQLPALSGREALAALVVGYEVAGRAGIALHASVEDYHTSGAWNALGVAAMAVRLRGGSAEMLRQAFGIAEYHGPRSQMMREIATPTMLHDGSGWGGLAGLSAAILAEEGFTGAPAVTVEAPEAAQHWADLGRFWHVPEQYVKPYPVCRWAHPAIDAVREICASGAVVPERIAAIRIRSFENAVRLFPTMPGTSSEAQYSLAFAVGTMIVHGRIGLAEISGAGLADPAVARLVALTSAEPEPRHEARFPEARWADVAITMEDGIVHRSGDVHARGGPERPFDAGEVTAKYRSFAEPVLGAARAGALSAAALGLTREGSRFADLLATLHAPAEGDGSAR